MNMIETSNTKVMRGGSWYYNPNLCRSASRFNNNPEDEYIIFGFGFRVVCDDPETEEIALVETSNGKIIRGGSWACDPSLCHSAHRYYYNPEDVNGSIGFRVVCDNAEISN